MSDDEAAGRVFRALGDPTRRRILDLLKAQPGMRVGEVAAPFSMSRIAVMKHLRVLEQADLVVSRKEGRTRLLYLNAVPIQAIYERWTTEMSGLWAGRLIRLKGALEGGDAQGEGA